MMRSLAVKLTLAFLAVGVSGAILVAVISGQRTRLEFDRFVADRRGNPVVTDLLLGYFLKDESWDGVERWLDSDPSLGLLGRRVVLAGNDQTIIYSSAPEQRGLNAADLDLGSGIPIESGGQSVGTAYLQSRSASGESVSRFSPESFLPAQRESGNRARGFDCRCLWLWSWAFCCHAPSRALCGS